MAEYSLTPRSIFDAVGGCRLEINAPLPAKETLHARARLEDIDDNGRRAVIHQRVATGTGAHPDAVVGHLYAVVPLHGIAGAQLSLGDIDAAQATYEAELAIARREGRNDHILRALNNVGMIHHERGPRW